LQEVPAEPDKTMETLAAAEEGALGLLARGMPEQLQPQVRVVQAELEALVMQGKEEPAGLEVMAQMVGLALVM
jgi:hypothetical protein